MGQIAKEKGCSVAQLAIAWVMAQGDDIIALAGARRRDRWQEALGALQVRLSRTIWTGSRKLFQSKPWRANAIPRKRWLC